MPVDAVFCDRSGADFNEFVPVDLLLGPYMRDLQSNAAASHSSVATEGTLPLTLRQPATPQPATPDSSQQRLCF